MSETDIAGRLIVALDAPDLDRAKGLCGALAGLVGGVKIGKEFFTRLGPGGVAEITAGGQPLFLDLKFHDIPNTVAGAVRAAVALRPFMLNVHAAGGRAMMEAARDAAAEAAAETGCAPPLVLGVTVLTSLDDGDLAATGIAGGTLDQVKRLAALAQSSGLGGVVCSGAEIEALRALSGPDFKLVVPGIRPSRAPQGDQKRILTPAEAVARGADYLVIGRAITGADDPAAAARRIIEDSGDGGAAA